MSELLELIIRAAIESRRNSGVRPVAPPPPPPLPQQQPTQRMQPRRGFPVTPTNLQPPARPAPARIVKPVSMRPPQRVPPAIKQQRQATAPQPPPPRKKALETAPPMQAARSATPQGTSPMLTADTISRIITSRPGALRNMLIMSEVLAPPLSMRS